jgi:transcriptional regulator with XRE-family HTH domain
MNERIKQIRKELGLSQTKFVEGTGVTFQTISNIERRAGHKIKESTVNSICRKHRINPEWIKHGTEPKFLDSIKNEIGGYILTDIEKKIIDMYLRIPIEKRKDIEDFIITANNHAQKTKLPKHERDKSLKRFSDENKKSNEDFSSSLFPEPSEFVKRGMDEFIEFQLNQNKTKQK